MFAMNERHNNICQATAKREKSIEVTRKPTTMTQTAKAKLHQKSKQENFAYILHKVKQPRDEGYGGSED